MTRVHIQDLSIRFGNHNVIRVKDWTLAKYGSDRVLGSLTPNHRLKYLMILVPRPI